MKPSITIRMHLSTWRKIRKAIPAKKDETAAAYMQRVADYIGDKNCGSKYCGSNYSGGKGVIPEFCSNCKKTKYAHAMKGGQNDEH